MIPVLSLAPFMQLEGVPPGLGKTMMVAEYSKRTLGFLVHEVDRIIRVDWERVKAPESVLASNQGLITAVIELDGSNLVSILDVEQILANAFGEAMIVDITPAKVDAGTSVFLLMTQLSRVAKLPRCLISWVSAINMQPTAWKPGLACRVWQRMRYRAVAKYATRFD